jgi:hypothetical protein
MIASASMFEYIDSARAASAMTNSGQSRRSPRHMALTVDPRAAAGPGFKRLTPNIPPSYERFPER